MACKYWDKELNQCIHPASPQHGDCDWSYNESCPYSVDESYQDPLIDFFFFFFTNSHKCQHCIHCFHGSTECGCINAYHCIGNDYADYNEGDE